MIKTSTFNIMNKKNVNLFFVILNNVKKHIEKYNKSNIVIKNIFLIKYYEFLNVFNKKHLIFLFRIVFMIIKLN
jgi:hypothetical protein